MLIIEKIVDDIVVIENGNEHFHLSKKEIPLNAKEGDILKKENEKYIFDLAETEKRKKELFNLQNSLFE